MNKKIVLTGDGKAIRDFIHFSDICKGIESLIESESIIENIFHFSSSKSISMIDVAIEVKKVYFQMYGVEIPIYINSVEKFISEQKTQRTNDSISNSLAKKYNINFAKDLKEGIRDLFTYLEIQPWKK